MNSCAIITQRSSYCICSRMNLWEMNDLRATRWKEHKKKREIKFKASSNEIARIFYSKRHSILIAFVFNFCWTSSAYAISTDNISSIKYIEQQSPHGVKVNKYWWRNRDVPTQREESSRKKRLFILLSESLVNCEDSLPVQTLLFIWIVSIALTIPPYKRKLYGRNPSSRMRSASKNLNWVFDNLELKWKLALLALSVEHFLWLKIFAIYF